MKNTNYATEETYRAFRFAASLKMAADLFKKGKIDEARKIAGKIYREAGK